MKLYVAIVDCLYMLHNSTLKSRPVAGGGGAGCDAPPPPKSAKRSTFCYKMGSNGGLWGGLRPKGPLFTIKWTLMWFYEGATLYVQKVHSFGFRIPPQKKSSVNATEKKPRLALVSFNSSLLPQKVISVHSLLKKVNTSINEECISSH